MGQSIVCLQKDDPIGMLADLVRTAGKDDDLPMLECIRLHVDNGVLHGWSTNRYAAAHATAAVSGQIDDVFFLPTSAVKQLTVFRRSGAVEMSVDGQTIRFSDSETTLTFTWFGDWEYPDVPRAVGADTPEGGVTGFGFDGKFMAEIAAVAKRRREYIYAMPVPGRHPLHMQIGANYRAWLMPVTTKEPDWLAHSWTSAVAQ